MWGLSFTLLVLIVTQQLLVIGVKSQTLFQDVAVMAHVIGNGAMNMDYYFHSLGVACERQNVGLWRTMQQDYRECSNSRVPREGYYASLPKGSFEKMCRKRKTTEVCDKNFARDLDECLGGRKGSDALAFMYAYEAFSCRDIRDSENQLVSRSDRHNTISPGVFKCFPQLQDRILTCVKKDTYSNTQCSQFYTVQTCFAQFYSSYKSCNDIGVVGYLRDLFRSMSNELNCPEPNAWDNALAVSQQHQTETEDRRPFQFQDKLHYVPLSPNFQNNNAENFPTYQTHPGKFPSSPSQFQNGAGNFPISSQPQPNPGKVVPSSPPQFSSQSQNNAGQFPFTSNFQNKTGRFPSSPSSSTGNFPSSPDSENNAGKSFPSSPSQFPNIPGNFPSSLNSEFWSPVSLLIPVAFNMYHPPQPHPQSPPHSNSQVENKNELSRAIPLQHPPIFGSLFNLEQKSDRRGPEPPWTLDYERYANPSDNTGKDRFYSFRPDTSAEVDRGVYDIYQIHSDRYGFPRSRGLNNRNGKNIEFETSTSGSGIGKGRKSWGERDNHLRKFKNDHEFQEQTTTRNPLPPYNFPSSSNSKRKAPQIRIQPQTIDNTNASEGVEDDALIQSVYNIEEPSRIGTKPQIRTKQFVVRNSTTTTTTPIPLQIPSTLKPRYKPRSRVNGIFISTTREPQRQTVKVFRNLATPIPLAESESDSESEESFQAPSSTTTTTRPRILKKIKVFRKRKPTTTTTEFNRFLYSDSTEY